MPHPVLMFDNSTLSMLANSNDWSTVQKALVNGYQLWISSTNLVEQAATTGRENRMRIVRNIAALFSHGYTRCVYPPDRIVKTLFDAFTADPVSFAWDKPLERFLECEEEYARPELIKDGMR